MKWHTEVASSKTDFMKVNSLNFIENEKSDCALLHEKNTPPKIQSHTHEVRSTTASGYDNSTHQVQENKSSRTTSDTITVSQSKTDFTGSSPKTFTTKCFLKPSQVPVWYTESVVLKIGSTKRRYQEVVHFKTKVVPFRWIEDLSTEIKTGPQCIVSEFVVPLIDDEKGTHYISLEPQQIAAQIDNGKVTVL